jgi:hypothetical protein
MKALLTAAAVVLTVGVLAPAAHAQGPRASSENNWPGITDPSHAAGYAYPVYQAPPHSGSEPRYVWKEGYSHGGRWQGGWVLSQ